MNTLMEGLRGYDLDIPDANQCRQRYNTIKIQEQCEFIKVAHTQALEYNHTNLVLNSPLFKEVEELLTVKGYSFEWVPSTIDKAAHTLIFW